MISAYLLLEQQIRHEIANVEQAIARTQRSAAGAKALSDTQDRAVYIESATLNLQSFYTGLERIFQLIAEGMEKRVPVGERWHSDLLAQMSLDLPDLRPAVLQAETRDLLDEYRAFRHRIRHMYTFQLDHGKVFALTEQLPAVWTAVQQDLHRFLAFLQAVAQSDIDSA